MLDLLVFIIILSILIFVHEIGHYLVAKKSGIKVEEFGFGIPPKIWGKKIGETTYSINALPIGGFVRMAGENEEEEGSKERQFVHKPASVRALVTIAGVVMNFLLAIFIFSFIYTKLGIPTPTDQVRIVAVAPNSPAEQSGLSEGDIVLKANNQVIKETQEFIQLTQKSVGESMTLEIKRGDQIQKIKVETRQNPPENEGPIGVGISNIENKFYPFWEMPIRGAIEGVKESIGWMVLIVEGLGTMVYRLFTSGAVPQDVAGPVGIYQITGAVAKLGFLPTLRLLGLLSINLAVVNLLPIPALDGGRLLFIAIEAVARKRVKTQVEALAHQIGFAFLIALIILLTYHDIVRIAGTTDLAGRLREILP
ncbi:MAG: RIP metalloprotease RseP [bacterium]|nr:RIP metalloprotease RseP [bacterium]